jgi:hypothetical protein
VNRQQMLAALRVTAVGDQIEKVIYYKPGSRVEEGIYIAVTCSPKN